MFVLVKLLIKKQTNMSEQALKDPNQRPDVDPNPDWEAVFDAVKQIGLPLDPIARAEDIAAMSGVDLAMMNTCLHSVLAPAEDQNPTSYIMPITDPRTGEQTHQTLDPQDRMPLYNHAASLLHELSKEMSGHEEEFLARASNVIGLTAVMAHSFAEGNGRTARFMSFLVWHAEDQTPEAIEELKMLGSNRPEEGQRVISFIPHLDDLSPSAFLDRVACREVPLDDPARYVAETKRLFDTPFVPLAP